MQRYAIMYDALHKGWGSGWFPKIGSGLFLTVGYWYFLEDLIRVHTDPLSAVLFFPWYFNIIEVPWSDPVNSGRSTPQTHLVFPDNIYILLTFIFKENSEGWILLGRIRGYFNGRMRFFLTTGSGRTPTGSESLLCMWRRQPWYTGCKLNSPHKKYSPILSRWWWYAGPDEMR